MPYYAGEGWEGNVKTKPKTNKKPKQNWKTLKATKRGGLPASVLSTPRTSVLWGWKLTIHCGVFSARLRTCTEPASSDEQVLSGRRTEHLSRSPHKAGEPCFHISKQDQTPGTWSSDKTRRLSAIKTWWVTVPF